LTTIGFFSILWVSELNEGFFSAALLGAFPAFLSKFQRFRAFFKDIASGD
jgi:hypothetical protein